jgi:hypothetical protein
MVKVIDTRTTYWAETKEYKLEIDGNQHTFIVYDSSHEEPSWIFDGVQYDDEDDAPLIGITIGDLLTWL